MRPPQVGAPGAEVEVGGRARGGVHGEANAGIVQAGADERKALDRLRAVAALAGLRVHALDAGGGFVVIDRLGWCSRELRDTHALAQTLRGLGVRL